MKLSKRNLNNIKNLEKEKNFFIRGISKIGITSMEQFLKNLGFIIFRKNLNNKGTNYLVTCYCFEEFDKIYNLTNYHDSFGDTSLKWRNETISESY